MRTTLMPGVSRGTRIMDCCLYLSGFFASVLPMKMRILQRGSPMPEVHHLSPLMTYESPSRMMLDSMFVASEEATLGSVMAKAERILPSSNGWSHSFFCSGEPYRSIVSMLPVSGAEQLKASGAMGERPMISQSGAYSRLVRPAPRSLSGRNRFQRPRSRALALSSTMMGGICHRVGPELSWSEKTCSLGATCLFMKSVSCSMYILVFFEYSNSMWALPAPVPLVRCASAPDVAPTLGPSRAIVNAGGGPASGLGEPSVVEKCETYATSGADHALDLRHGYRDGELGIPRARGGARADPRGPHDAVDRHLWH